MGREGVESIRSEGLSEFNANFVTAALADGPADGSDDEDVDFFSTRIGEPDGELAFRPMAGVEETKAAGRDVFDEDLNRRADRCELVAEPNRQRRDEQVLAFMPTHGDGFFNDRLILAFDSPSDGVGDELDRRGNRVDDGMNNLLGDQTVHGTGSAMNESKAEFDPESYVVI